MIIRKTAKFADDHQNFYLTFHGKRLIITIRLRKIREIADFNQKERSIAMKSRMECLQEYGSDYFVRQQIDAGNLFRLEKGIYSEQKKVPELALLMYKYPNAVVTMHNAFYMHGLTDVIPDEYDLATDRDSAKIHDKRVKQFFYPKDSLYLGVEKNDYKGYVIPVYGLERMLVELIRYKSKLPFEYYKEIILSFRKMLPKMNIQKVQDYALAVPKSNRILETLQMEVL